jgi:hypothetical protein
MHSVLKFLLVSILTVAILPAGAQPDPAVLEWSETWDFQNELFPSDIIIDHRNDVYSSATIFNEENSNIMLLKYAANKTLLWAKEFDNGDNEIVSNMMIRGNAIYLVGKAGQLLSLLKYDNNGELLYAKYASVKTEGLPSLDVDAKHVYVVIGNWLIKYDKMNGEVSQTYKLTENNKDEFTFIEVYGKNLYLVGQLQGKSEIVTQKRDLDGNLLWNVNKESYLVERAYDTYIYNGMLYITGIQGDVLIGREIMRGAADLLLIKYDKNGNLLWEKTWGTNSTLDWGFGSKVYRNKLYVVGLTSADYLINGTNGFLQEYNINGDMGWNIVTSEIKIGVAVDVKDDEIFVVGSNQNNVLIQQYGRKG